MKHWLDELVQRDIVEAKSFTRTQMQAGWVHARIKVPEHLVSRGFRELKQNIGSSLRATRLSREELASAIQFISILLDLALDVMTCAYIARSERSARSDEAFRLFSVSQNLGTERQRAALSEWAQSLFFELQMSHNLPSTPLLSQSDFGLWVFHRAILSLDHSTEYDRLVDVILDIDGAAELLRSSTSEDRVDQLRKIKGAIDEINSLMTLLFDRSLEAQGARDPLTQLLNRKFINTVISAEIAARRHSFHPFSTLLLEIDQFDDLRARLGEAEADVIVQRTAQLIFDTARMSDSVFSMGR